MSAPSTSSLSVTTSYRRKIWLFYLFCTTWVPECPNNESVSNFQLGDLLNECSFGLFGFNLMNEKQLSLMRN